MIKYIIFPGRTDYSEAIFSDLRNYSDVIFEKQFQYDTLNKINILHTSCKSNSIVKLPFQHFWYKMYLNYDVPYAEDVLIFLCEENRLCYDKEFIDYLRLKIPNSRVVFFPVNSLSVINRRYHDLIFRVYDHVVTFDKGDADKYGWIYYGRTLSNKEYQNTKSQYDVFYAGSNSGRLDLLHKVYAFLCQKGLECLFYITEVDDSEQLQGSKIVYNRKLSYKQILDFDNKSKCILEILRDGQDGSTLRFAEAITFGKKLLTNNRSAIYEKDYDSDYISIFSNVNEIDSNFILNPVKRAHSNNISPRKMIEYVYQTVFS